MITMILAIGTIIQVGRICNWITEDLAMLNADTVHLSYLLMKPLFDAACGDETCSCSYTGICTKSMIEDLDYRSPDRWVKEY